MSEEQQEALSADPTKARKRPRRRRRRGGSAAGGSTSSAEQPQQVATREPSDKPARSPKPQQQPKQQRPHKQPQQRRDERPAEPPYRLKTPAEKFGGRDPVAPPRTIDQEQGPTYLPLNGFELFCAYHLGITEDNQHRRQSARDVARRFGISPDELQAALNRYGLDMSTITRCGYDMELALLDIRVAPDGIDRRELAKGLYDELLNLNPYARAAEDGTRP
jgi:hypothetical protein